MGRGSSYEGAGAGPPAVGGAHARYRNVGPPVGGDPRPPMMIAGLRSVLGATAGKGVRLRPRANSALGWGDHSRAPCGSPRAAGEGQTPPTLCLPPCGLKPNGTDLSASFGDVERAWYVSKRE